MSGRSFLGREERKEAVRNPCLALDLLSRWISLTSTRCWIYSRGCSKASGYHCQRQWHVELLLLQLLCCPLEDPEAAAGAVIRVFLDDKLPKKLIKGARNS